MTVIAIEGLWGTGKSTLGLRLADRIGGEYIPEPDHLLEADQLSPKDQSEWYYERLHQIRNDADQKDGLVILDRTLASWAAYRMCSGENVSMDWRKRYKRVTFTFLLLPTPVILHEISDPNHPKFSKTPLLRNVSFISEYQLTLTNLVKDVSATVTTLPARDNQNLEIIYKLLKGQV